MSDGGNVIILGQLNTKELEDSINKLVDVVKKGTETMAETFDSGMSKMQKSLSGLTGLSSDFENASNQRRNALKREKQDVDETISTYDNLAQALNKKMAGEVTDARQVRIHELMEKMRNDLQQISSIKAEPMVFSNETISKIETYKTKIEETKNKIKELTELSFKQAHSQTGTGYNLDYSRTTQQIEYAKKGLAELESELTKLQQSERNAFSTDTERRIAQLRNNIEAYKKEIQELNLEMGRDTKAYFRGEMFDEQIRKGKELQQTEQDTANKRQALQASLEQSHQEQMRMQQELNEQIRKNGAEAIQSSQKIIDAAHRALSEKVPMNTFLDPQKFKTEGDVLKQLYTDITNLRAAYYRLSVEERETDFGQSLKKAYENASNARIAIEGLLRSEMGLSQSEKNLESKVTKYNDLKATIARLKYEYEQLSDAEKYGARGYELEQKIQRETESLKQLETEVQKASIALEKEKEAEDQSAQAKARAGQEADKLKSKHVELEKSNTALGRSFQYIKNRLAFYLTVGASTSFIKQLAEIRGQYEMTERSLQILVDSAERGHEIFTQLGNMALNSPFTTIELTDAARQLSAMGFETSELVGTVKRLGDISAAIGAPIDRIAYALGQVQTYGYLTSIQARTFMRMGIPLVKELADNYSQLEGRVVSTADVMQRMKDHAISYADVMAVINKETDAGGRFFDYQAKVADTLKVQLSNLHLAWENMLNDIGKSNQTMLSAPIKLLKTLFMHWNSISKLIYSVAIGYGVMKLANMNYLLTMRRQITAENNLQMAMVKRRLKMKSLTDTQRANLLAQKENLLASRQYTSQMYKQAIEENNLKAAQVRKLFLMNKGNFALKRAILATGLLTKEEMRAALASQSLGMRLSRMWQSNGLFLVVTAIAELIFYIFSADEAMKQLNEDVRNGAKETAESLRTYLDQLKESNVYSENLVKDEKGDEHYEIKVNFSSTEEANKAWAEMRKQIEDTTKSGGVLINELLGIDDVNERIAKGVEYLEQFEDVMKKLSAIEKLDITRDTFMWGLFGEGFTSDLKDFLASLEELRKFERGEDAVYLGGDWFSNKHDLEDFSDFAIKSLAEVEAEADKSAQKIYKAFQDANIDIANTTPEAMYEAFQTAMTKIGEQEKWTRNERYDAWVLLENSFTKIMKQAWESRIRNASATQKKGLMEQRDAYFQYWNGNLSAYQVLLDVVGNSFSSEMGTIRKHAQDANYFIEGEGKAMWNRWLAYIRTISEQAYAVLKNWTADVNTLESHIKIFFDYYDTGSDILEDQRKYNAQLKKLYNDLEEAQKAYRYAGNTDKPRWNKKISEIQADIDKFLKNHPGSWDENREAKAEREREKAEAKAERERKKAEAKAERERKKRLAEQKRQAAQAAKMQREQESELAKALKDEISLVDKLRSAYEKLHKAGANKKTTTDALKQIAGEPLEKINKVLKNYGMSDVNEVKLSDFFDEDKGVINYTELYNFYKGQIEELKKTGKAINGDYKALGEQMIEIFTDSIVELQKEIDKRFSEKLDNFSDRWEISLQYQEDPELMNMIAQSLGLDWTLQLDTGVMPQTLNDLIDSYNTIINDYLRQKLESLPPIPIQKKVGDVEYELSRVDIVANKTDVLDLREYNEGLKTLKNYSLEESELYKMFMKMHDEILKHAKTNLKDIDKAWEDLIGKYGDYQSKMDQIVKETAEEQANLVKIFGTEHQQKDAITLLEKIKIEKDPKELDRLTNELYDLLQQAINDNKRGLDLSTAIKRAKAGKMAKLEWDTFKESDMYSKMFEDMERNSTMSLKIIIDKLDELKNKVKDDPASMKSLMSAYKQAREELERRNPFGALVEGAKEWIKARKEVKDAKAYYFGAQEAEEYARKALESYQKLPEEKQNEKSLISLIQQHADKLKLLDDALKAYIDAQDGEKKAAKKFTTALKNSEQSLSNISSVLKDFTELLGIAEDSEAGIMINSLSQGFSTMATALGMVASIAELAQQKLGWVTVVAVALSALVGLVSWLANSKNERINRKIKESERLVSKLENAYKDLQDAVEQAYGTAKIGAEQVAIANKKLQLVELERQLALEKSRDSKHRDEDAIISLEGQIIDLKNEIKNATEEIVNDLLGISSVGDFAENLVSSMMEAFKNGEDYMKVFEESFEEMVDNMIMKAIVGQVIGQWIERLVSSVQEKIDERQGDAPDRLVQAQKNLNDLESLYGNKNKSSFLDYIFGGHIYTDKKAREKWQQSTKQWEAETGQKLNKNTANDYYKWLYDTYHEKFEQDAKQAQKEIDAASIWTAEDVSDFYQMGMEGKEELIQLLEDSMERYGVKFGQSSDKDLSALQQGIQGITEDTAGALEAYMNGVSQQVYYQSGILAEINNTLRTFDFELQSGVKAQILLSLQQSYQIQMAIRNTLVGWSNPSGQAVRVEMI